MVSNNDVVIAISSSGESEEIINILPNIKMIGSKLIAITSNPNSTLVKYSDYSQIFPKFQEACYFNMAPTSSTTATLVYGDTLAVVASKYQGFNEKNPSRRISKINLMQSYKNRQRRIDKSEDGIYLSKKREDARDAGYFAFGE
mgnify:CR=1 FL=1